MQNLTVKEYADIIRGQRPDLSNVEDDYLAREYLGYYPEHRDLFNKESLSNLYKIKGSERGSDTQFSVFQGKEMLANIPAAVVGGLGALTGNKDIIQYSEDLRAKALEDTRVRMRNPELQGYLTWMEEEPITFKNMLQPQMFQRGLAQAAPSIASMLAVDIGLNLVTYGVGGTLLKGATVGKKAMSGFQALSAARKGEKTTKAAMKVAKVSEGIRTAGTMTTMGAMEGAEQYNSTIQYLIEKGVDLEQANKVAAISGAAYMVVSSILETIPYGTFKKRLGIGSIKNRKMFQERMLKALDKQGAWQSGKTITEPMIKQAILESGTEYGQFLSSELINYYNKRGYEEVPETALKYLHSQMFTPEAIESAYSGGVMGVTMGLIPGGRSALSGKARIERVLADTDKEVIKGMPSEKESDDEPIETSSRNSRVKLGAFINSYDNLNDEEEEIARELSSDYFNDNKTTLKEIKDVIKNDPEALNDLSDEERFDVFAGISDLDPEVSIEDLQKGWEDSLKDEPDDKPVDEPPIDEPEKPIDITPPKKEKPKVQKAPSTKPAPKKKKKKTLNDIGRVNLSYDDKGNIEVTVDEEVVDLDDDDLDTLQSGIAYAEENDDDTKVEKAMLSILNKVDNKPSEIKDEPSIDEPQEPIDEPQETGAIDITPKKETLPKLRKRAQGLGVENVKKKNKKELLNEINKIEEAEKAEKAVEAHDRAKHPELFIDKLKEDEKDVHPSEINQSYDKKLQYLRQRAEETVEDVDLIMKDTEYEEGWDSKASERSVKRSKKKLEEFENDPISYLERENAEDRKNLKKGIFDTSGIELVKNDIDERQAIIDKLKAEKTKPAPKKDDEVHQKMPKKKTYEVTTRGDARFSAFNAILSDGKSIEHHYQVHVKGYSSMSEGKGKPPKDKNKDLDAEYQALWDRWADENPDLIEDLREKSKGKKLTDMFSKKGSINQATALTRILERTSPKKAKETPKGKPTLNSGGADGADSIFERFAIAAGHIVKAMSFQGHNTESKNRFVILPSLLKKADKFLKKANQTLKRRFPTSYEKTNNLLRRNYYQVKDVNQVIAIGHLTPLKNQVRGGTGWAVQMAIDLGRVENKMADKDIHVFDLGKNEWTKWDGKKFVKAEAPVLSDNYAGIGARPYSEKNLFGITKEGEAAIKALYEKPRKLTNQEKAMGFKEGEIEASIEATEEMMEQEKRGEEIDNEVAVENELVDKKTPKEEVNESREKAELKENEAQEDEVDEKIDVESDIFKNRLDSKNFHYTEGQKNVLNKIVDYLSSKIENVLENYFVFAGYAGTGKTTVVENIVNYAKGQGFDVWVAAPTNKAVLRLDEKRMESVEGYEGSDEQKRYEAALSTLHVILYGVPDENGIWVPKTSMFDEKTLVVIDESSMISEEVWEDIQKYIAPTGAKIILIGDGFQLPPIGDDLHLMDRFVKKGYQMMNVVRQAAESNIIKWATTLRVGKSVLYPNESADDVIIMSENEVLDKYYDDIINNEDSIVIVATNGDRTRINAGARAKKFGNNASINLVNNNEHLIVVNNSKFKRKNGETFIYEGKDIIPGEAIEVEYVEKMAWNKETRQKDIPIYKKTKIYAFEDSEGYPIFIAPDLMSASLHAGNIALADKKRTEEGNPKNDMEKLANAFPSHMVYNSKSSKWQFEDTVNVVTYGYAITAHKSQGSEWKNVYVVKDFGWAKFMDDEQKARWLYTAITRASEKLYLNRGLITDGASWDEMQFSMNRAGAIENDKTNEKLQEIRSGQKILNNKELSKKIAKRLRKQFPFIDGIAVQRVYDKYGREVAGKAIDSMVMWSINEGTLDTVPHEYAHIYVDLLSESPIIKKGIEKFREKNDTLEEAEERLVQYMGEYYANRIQEKSLLKKLSIWLKQFWLNIKKPFNKMTKKEMGDYLGEKFYQDSISKQTKSLSGEVRYQQIASGSIPFMEAVLTFKNGFNDYKAYIRKNSGWFKKTSPGVEKEDALVTQYLNILRKNNLDPIFEPMLKAFLDTKQYTDGSEYNIDFDMDDSQEFFENIWEKLNKNLSSISTADKDMVSMNKANSTAMKDLGILTKTALKRLSRTARRVNFNQFIEVMADYLKKSAESMTDKQIRASRQLFNSVRSSVKANRDNPQENERTNYELYLIESPVPKGKNPLGSREIKNKDGEKVIQYFRLKRKGKSNERTGKDNPSNERRFLVENILNLQEISWISSGDIIHRIEDEDKSLYSPLSTEQISHLSRTLRLKDKNGNNLVTGTKDSLMIAFNRGESQKYALVLVTQEHRNSVNEGEAYWQDKNLTKKQIDNFMLKRYEGDDRISKELLEVMKAEEIARFEILEKIFSGHMLIDAAKIFKRLKLPLTPAVVSKDLPSQIGRIFDKDNATFVVKDENGKDKAVGAIVDVQGQKKYRLDGSSLTSTKLFKDFIKYFGMKINVAKAKTVIAAMGEAGKLFVKHQHFKPLKPLSIYENYGKDNQVLIAKIDENGNITDKNGDDIHVLFTEDEAKIFDGDYATGENFTIPGNAFGLLTMPNKKHSDTKSTMQLYNYVHNKAILDLWKSEMFPSFRKRLRKAFTMGRVAESKTPQLQIKQFFEILSGGDTGIPDSAFELFKLGLGLHSFGSTLLDKLIQTQIVEEATTMSKMPGLSGDTIVDITGDLKYTEISVPIADATIIIQDYMKANPNDTRNFKDIQREGMKQVNNWLKNANYQMLISRSPVPHIGGAKMVTVKSVHGNDGQIHLHWMLLFKDLEGDGDGDKVQIEKLPKPLEDEFIKLYKDLEVEAIDLSSLGKPKKYDLSLREHLNELISAITYGSKAIAEISNTAMSFGILQETFSHIEYQDKEGSPYKLKIRNGSDIVKDKASGVTNTLDNILRIYLQAAADNVEFLLLQQWEYNQDDLANTLFYRDDNQPLNSTDMYAISTLMRTVKKSSNIKYGRSFKDGSWTFSKTISESNKFNKFTKDKEAYIRNALYVENDDSQILDVRFKFDSSGNFNMHPHEMIASEISTMYEDYIESWHADSPFKLDPDIYFQAHLHTINKMMMDDSILEEIEGSGAIKGVKYARRLGMQLDDMFAKLSAEGKDVGINGWDTNELMINFLDKFKKEFDALTPIEKRAATYQYLQGTHRRDGTSFKRISERQIILPSSKDPLKVSLLDADVLSNFFNIYNDFISDEIKLFKMKENPLQTKEVKRLNFIQMTQEEKDVQRNCRGK